MLYLIATPIGNLEDITFRAVSTLRQCRYVLCEDTRHSQILLQHYNITTPLKSFHQFNEISRENLIIEDLRQGHSLGLISDAGTPTVCDPGRSLVMRCYQEAIPVTAVPGPSAWVTAMALSPFPVEKVQFLGFLPKPQGERVRAIAQACMYPGATLCYESPHRLVATLGQIPPQQRVAVFRELTKIHEERKVGTSEELALHYQQHPPRGECVLLLAPAPIDYGNLDLNSHVQFVVDTFHLPLKEAIKIVAELRHISKPDLYSRFCKDFS